MKKINLKNKQISESPYSNSWYVTEIDETIDWNTKPEGSIRIADHWNWQDDFSNKIHCPIENAGDEPIYKKLVCIYTNGKYKILNIDYKETLKKVEEIFEENMLKNFTPQGQRRYKERKLQKEKEREKEREKILKKLKNNKYNLNCIYKGSFRLYETKNNRNKSINRELLELLEFLKIKFKTKNDSPRGAKSGDYVEIDKFNIEKFKGEIENVAQNKF